MEGQKLLRFLLNLNLSFEDYPKSSLDHEIE